MAIKTRKFLDLGDLSAPKGSPEWCRAVREEARECLNDANRSRESVKVWVGALREDGNYRNLTNGQDRHFRSWEEFCTTPQPHGLGYSSREIDAIIAERKSAEAKAEKWEDEPALTFKERARVAVSKRNNGRDIREYQSSTLYHNVDRQQQGDSSDYLTRRIARDRPDILEDMKAGKYDSVRQAALDAGIVRKRVSIAVDPQLAAGQITKHFSEAQVVELIELLAKAIENTA